MSNDGKSNFEYYFNSLKINIQDFGIYTVIIHEYCHFGGNIWVTIVDSILGVMRTNVNSSWVKNSSRSN